MNVNQDAKLSSTDFVIHPVRSGYDTKCSHRATYWPSPSVCFVL